MKIQSTYYSLACWLVVSGIGSCNLSPD